MFKGEIENYGLDLYAPSLLSDLPGLFSIFLVSLITWIIALRYSDISKIILTALFVRILVILIGHYVIYLPDTKADALGHEWAAWNIAQGGFFNTFKNFTGPGSHFYSWLMAIPYSLFGRSILIIQSIGLLFGIGSVFLGWLLAKKMWDEYSATKVGWLLALFPSLVLYSIIPLKEVYCSFFVLVAMFGAFSWVKTKNFKFAFLSMGGFFAAGFFHGPLFLGGFLFSIIFFMNILINTLKSLSSFRINLKDLIMIILILLILISYLTNEIYLPYVGTFESHTNLNLIMDSIINRSRGDASYPDWLIIKTPIEFIYKSFIRIMYFLFSPFPWEISKLTHLIGVFDGILYIILVFLIICNLKVIWRDPALRVIFLILSFYLFIYGIGVSNFGAGTRHRSKFIIIIALLIAPLIPRVIFFKSKKIK